jgi:hypothetical protein
MDRVRVILVAWVAFSVAVVPLAGRMAFSMPHGMSFAAQQADCCPHGKPCEKKTGDCGSLAGCALKCFNFSGSVPAPLTVALAASVLEEPAFVLQIVHSPSDGPPFPPPRI